MNICPYCKRIFKSERGLKVHLAYCEKKMEYEKQRSRELYEIGCGYLKNWNEANLPLEERCQLIAERCLKEHEKMPICEYYLVAEVSSLMEKVLGLREYIIKCHVCKSVPVIITYFEENLEELEKIKKLYDYELNAHIYGVFNELVWYSEKATLIIRHPKFTLKAIFSTVIKVDMEDDTGTHVPYLWFKSVDSVSFNLSPSPTTFVVGKRVET